MASNIYLYQERIWFSAEPSDHWGWWLSTTSDATGNTWFDSQNDLNKFVKIINNKLDRRFEKREVFSGAVGEWESAYVACILRSPRDEWMLEELRENMSKELVDALDEISESEAVQKLL